MSKSHHSKHTNNNPVTNDHEHESSESQSKEAKEILNLKLQLLQLKQKQIENPLDEISKISLILGIIIGISIILIILPINLISKNKILNFKQFIIYILSISTFHFFEFFITSKYNFEKINIKSFLINNGIIYNLTHFFAIIETIIEIYYFPSLKNNNDNLNIFLTIFGLLAIIIGHLFRSISMIQSSTNFSHLIEKEKREQHVLITHGVYSISRHPSYFGFFWWAVGTQLMLVNPISIVLFSLSSWYYFQIRIECKLKFLF